MATQFYNIAGVEVPYDEAGIDQGRLKETIGKTATLYRTSGKQVDVEILDVEWDLSIRYREVGAAPYEGKCYWYRFYRRQNTPL